MPQEAEDVAKVVSVISTMIVRVGHVLQDIKSSLAARKAVLNDHIAAATSVHAALGTPYSPDNAEHVKLLQRLWGACFLDCACACALVAVVVVVVAAVVGAVDAVAVACRGDLVWSSYCVWCRHGCDGCGMVVTVCRVMVCAP